MTQYPALGPSVNFDERRRIDMDEFVASEWFGTKRFGDVA